MNFRINQAASVSVHELSQKIMRDYDANGNGKIDLNRPVLANHGQTEAYRQDLSFSENDGLVSHGRELNRKALFEAADAAGDHDGAVSATELESFIGSFDTNHDGQLESRGIQGMRKGRALGELELFNRRFDESRSDAGI